MASKQKKRDIKKLGKYTFIGIAFLLFLVGIALFTPLKVNPVEIPAGKDFIFSIIDDTDRGTVKNLKPVYDYLHELGMKTTKSIWIYPTNNPEDSSHLGQAINDGEYYSFVKDIQEKGFEISLHGVRGGDSTREEIREGLEIFGKKIGHYPAIHANHAHNRDNLYWGEERLDFSLFKWIYLIGNREGREYFQGHVPGSPYFWGDLAEQHITYVRNFTFEDINTLKKNPSMPYHIQDKPYINFWFSASEGSDRESFNELLSRENLDQLEKENGVSIVYTHFGKGFVEDGRLNEKTKERLKDLASRNGYFVPVSEVMLILRARKKYDGSIPLKEALRMQIRWMLEKVF